MSKKCIKCGYVRQSTDVAPDYECPSCGVVYAKVEAALKDTIEREASTKAAAEKTVVREEKTCPYCHEQIHVKAIRCKHCHADLSVAAKEQAKPTVKAAPPHKCPSCRSENVQRKELVHLTGTTRTKSAGIGVGVGAGGAGVGVGLGRSRNQSELAAKHSAPEGSMHLIQMAAVIGAVAAFPFAAINGLMAPDGKGSAIFWAMEIGLGLVFFVIAAVWLMVQNLRNKTPKILQEAYQHDAEQLDAYKRSYVCLVCGHEFIES